MNAGERLRLAVIEHALVGAAERQAQERRRRRRRAIVILAVAAPLMLAAAGSVAATGFLSSVDQRLSTLRDDRLAARPGGVKVVQDITGAHPRDRGSRVSWLVAGHRLIGYPTVTGSFCFVFVRLTAGCIPKDTLTRRNPVEYSSDNAPGTFRIYGLAMDGVTRVSLRARGVTRRAIVGRNAFYLEANSLGNRRGFGGTLIVRLRDGATRLVPVTVGGTHTPKPLPTLPGLAPVANTAA